MPPEWFSSCPVVLFSCILHHCLRGDCSEAQPKANTGTVGQRTWSESGQGLRLSATQKSSPLNTNQPGVHQLPRRHVNDGPGTGLFRG